MASLPLLISAYPILRSLASFISSRDLFNLARTCKSNYQNILSSKRTFHALRRHCLCDGLGVLERQNFNGLYFLRGWYVWGDERRIWNDEPIEVRLYNTKCEVEALPCCKCGINICEECRYYPREPPPSSRQPGRPHLNAAWQSENVMCLCPECDGRVEEEVRGRFLNELCDCNAYARWICSKCVKEERKFTRDYYEKHTAMDGYGETKHMTDHQFDRDFYCLCGNSVPQDTRPRCTWCRRRHLPETEWYDEWRELGRQKPVFEDPCYPVFLGSRYNTCSDPMYPKLPYDGPIWQA